jgi:hypothetical protein
LGFDWITWLGRLMGADVGLVKAGVGIGFK